MKKIAAFFCALFLAGTVSPASAQKKHHDWSGGLAAEAMVQTGNVETQFLTLRGDVSTLDSVVEVGFHGEFAYGEQDNIKNQQLLLGAATVDFWSESIFSPFLLGTAETNFQRQIDLRWQAGGGVKWLFWNDTTNEVSFSAAALFDATEYDPLAELDPVRTGRGSFRLKGKHILLNTYLVVTHTTFFQPSLSWAKDFRWNTLITFDVPLSAVVSLRASVGNTFENIVPPDKKKHDAKLLFGLKLTM